MTLHPSVRLFHGITSKTRMLEESYCLSLSQALAHRASQKSVEGGGEGEMGPHSPSGSETGTWLTPTSNVPAACRPAQTLLFLSHRPAGLAVFPEASPSDPQAPL